jgi:hypothetical protein
MESSAPTL